MPIDLSKIRAIDVHVHAEVSCHDPEDPVMGEFFDAASAYFKAPRERPKMPEIIELYRETNIAFCMFTVDCESGMGAKRVSNYEVAELAKVAEVPAGAPMIRGVLMVAWYSSSWAKGTRCSTMLSPWSEVSATTACCPMPRWSRWSSSRPNM